jgi:hypothetical protein
MRPDDVVPLAMKRIGVKIDSFHFVIGDGAPRGVLAAVQAASHSQALRGRRPGNEIHDGFVITQRLAPPIRRDEGKEAMLDLVPLAGPWRKMADGQTQTGFVGECLQLQLPQTQSPSVAAAGVSGHQDRAGRRIEPFPFMAPPAADRGHRKGAGVVIGADIDKPGVAPNVIDAIRIRPRHVSRGKVVTAHLRRLFRGTPLLAGVPIVANELLLITHPRT